MYSIPGTLFRRLEEQAVYDQATIVANESV